MFRSKAKQLLLDKSAAEGRHITQREVAEAIGVTETNLSLWFQEKPMLQIRSRTVVALCQYFDCGIEDLIGLDADKSPKQKTPLATPVEMVG